jgi:hypothetical protein
MVEEMKDESKDALFDTSRPEIMDHLFIKYQDILIIPGQRAKYESYLMKVSTETLQISNVVAIMSDESKQHTFQSLEIVGVAVVVETNPLVLATCERPENQNDGELPKHIVLFDVTSVFAFNAYGVKVLPKMFGQLLIDITEVLTGVHSWVPPPVNLSHSLSSHMHSYPPSTVPSSENTYKARKNADEIQPIKVLFRHDTACFLEFCGPLEDLSSDRVVAYVHGRVPESFLKLIALQGPNIHMLMRLRFQMVPDIGSETGKASKSLNLSQFRIPGAVVTSFYHVKAMFEKFAETMCAIVPNDDGFMDEIFADTIKLLNSSEERSLRNLNHTLVLRELNQRLIDFGMVLSGSTALTDPEKILAIKLREALYIDYGALFLKNLHKEHENMKRITAAAGRISHKRNFDYGGGQGGDGKRQGMDNTQQPGRGLCISQVCYVYLGAGKVFDGKPPLKPCMYQSQCRHSHDIPKAPVSVAQKEDVVRLLSLMMHTPQRRTALQKVTQLASFSV